jgi:hypothetical protein
MIVNFDGKAISQAIRQISLDEGQPVVLMPEALMSLLRGLEVVKKPTADLEGLFPEA